MLSPFLHRSSAVVGNPDPPHDVMVRLRRGRRLRGSERRDSKQTKGAEVRLADVALFPSSAVFRRRGVAGWRQPLATARLRAEHRFAWCITASQVLLLDRLRGSGDRPIYSDAAKVRRGCVSSGLMGRDEIIQYRSVDSLTLGRRITPPPKLASPLSRSARRGHASGWPAIFQEMIAPLRGRIRGGGGASTCDSAAAGVEPPPPIAKRLPEHTGLDSFALPALMP
jgi:hypothetical protein